MRVPLFFLFLFLSLSLPTTSTAVGTISLYQSVEQALKHSPQIQTSDHQSDISRHNLKQARSGYFPTVELSLGYGWEQHSDETTRRVGADPDDDSWDSRNELTLSLTQRLYDGGETGSQVSIQKSLLDGSEYRYKSSVLAVSLEAIAAHLGIVRDRELKDLAEQNLQIHRHIYSLLKERTEAGVGSVADLAHAQARMARAESSLVLSKAELDNSIAYYLRITGRAPDPRSLVYTGYPDVLPGSLERALEKVQRANPELLAKTSEVTEAEARLDLARTKFKPKIEVQLSSRYNDQLEGSASWENTNDAMINLRWNLYRGGADSAGKKAALSQKNMAKSVFEDTLFYLKKETRTTWTNFQSMKDQKRAFQKAVEYNHKTLEAYLEQFQVSRRSLVDLLIAANDFYHSSTLLINSSTNESLAAYEILTLTGDLKLSDLSMGLDHKEATKHPLHISPFWPITPYKLKTLLKTQTVFQKVGTDKTALALAPRAAHPDRPISLQAPPMRKTPKALGKSHLNDADGRYCVVAGPCLNKRQAREVKGFFSTAGLEFEENQGTGKVRRLRLFEGTYSSRQALKKLAKVRKTVKSAFLLREKNQTIGLYLGSFHNEKAATKIASQLQKMGFETEIVVAEVEMAGRIIRSYPSDKKKAESLIEKITEINIPAHSISTENQH